MNCFQSWYLGISLLSHAAIRVDTLSSKLVNMNYFSYFKGLQISVGDVHHRD